MLKFLADEDFDHRILKGLLKRDPGFDVVSVQDIGFRKAHDVLVLEVAARNGRILLTHDVATMSVHAYERVGEGLLMPGVIEVSQEMALREAIEEILLISECGSETDFQDKVIYLPL